MSVLLGKTPEVDQVLLTKPSDETRSFLSFSAVGDDADARTSMEQGLCRRARARGGIGVAWKYATACLLVGVAMLGVTVLVLELYRGREAASLRAQLDAVRRDVDALKHRLLEEDLLEQLKAFEDAVYAEEAASEDEDDDDNDDVDDAESDEYDVDYTDEKPTHARTHAPRSKREIAGATVPVISESYGVEFNGSEGLRLYERLVDGVEQRPDATTDNPIKDYHRVSPLWPSKTPKKYVGDAPAYRRHRGPSPPSTPLPAPIISRVSRVMQTDSSSDSLLRQPPPAPLKLRPTQETRKLPDGEVVVRVLQEQRASQGATVSGPGDVVQKRMRRKKPRLQRKNLAQLEGLDEVPGRPSRVLAAHYHGNATHRSLEDPHYDGNGRLRHPDGKFTDWTASSWMQNLGMGQFFHLRDGVVTVRGSGIYYVYAQIYYVDEHDVNGFRVYLNDNAMLHCTTMTVNAPAQHRRAKSNTCHTGAALYLAPGDKISVRDVDGLRYSLFEPAKSFFGLVKMGDARFK
ncbi:protein eiger-like [Periplaneta americana]|uniref:protein eiger-like n=1 Tax=Periplaneta americana TaxID=6978 RepID=UPI0037E8B862